MFLNPEIPPALLTKAPVKKGGKLSLSPPF